MNVSGLDLMKLVNGEWVLLLYFPFEEPMDVEYEIFSAQKSLVNLCQSDECFHLNNHNNESIIVHVKPGDVFKVKRVYEF